MISQHLHTYIQQMNNVIYKAQIVSGMSRKWGRYKKVVIVAVDARTGARRKFPGGFYLLYEKEFRVDTKNGLEAMNETFRLAEEQAAHLNSMILHLNSGETVRVNAQLSRDEVMEEVQRLGLADHVTQQYPLTLAGLTAGSGTALAMAVR